MSNTIIAQNPDETQEPVSASALRLRWEAAKRRLDTLLIRYAAGDCGTAIVEAAEQAEDRAYRAWKAAVG